MISFSQRRSGRRGVSWAGFSSLALMSALLLCGAGNVPVENFKPQGAMQADLNAGGHNVTNAGTISAASFAGGAAGLTNFPTGIANPAWTNLTGKPTTLTGYGITNAESSLGNPGTNGQLLVSTTSGTRSWTNLPTNITAQGNAFNSLHQFDTFTPTAGSILIIIGDSIADGFPLITLDGGGHPTAVNGAYSGVPWPQYLSGLPRWAGIPVYSFAIGGTYAAPTSGSPSGPDQSAGMLANNHYYTKYLNGAQVGTLYGNGPTTPNSLTATGSGVRYWVMAYGANNAYYGGTYATAFTSEMPVDCTTIHGYGGTNKIIGVSVIHHPGQGETTARWLSNWWRQQNAVALGTAAGWDYFADVEAVLNDMSDYANNGHAAYNNLSYDGTHMLGGGYALYANTVDAAMATLNTNPGPSRPGNPFGENFIYDFLGTKWFDNTNHGIYDNNGALAIDLGGSFHSVKDSTGAQAICWDQYGVQAKEAVFTTSHISGRSANPTIAAGSGAGTSPTVAVDASSSDVAGKISITTGTSPTASATVVTVTFASTYNTTYRSNIPYVALSPNNANAAALGGASLPWAGNETKTTFTLTAGSTALVAGTTYVFNYHVIQ